MVFARLFKRAACSRTLAIRDGAEFIDNQSTTFHRAAAHMTDGARTVLQKKGAAAIWTLDGSRRTALRRGVLSSSYEAFQTFVAKDKSGTCSVGLHLR